MSKAAISVVFGGKYVNVSNGVTEIEIGDPFVCRITIAASETTKVSAINITFGYRAHGASTTDTAQSRVISSGETEISAGVPLTLEFHSVVPRTEPLSWNGKLVKITWEVGVHLDIPWAFDQTEVFPVVVRPLGYVDRIDNEA